MKKKLKTYKVVRVVEYSMLIDAWSVNDVLTDARLGQLDSYWTRHEFKPIITREVEDNES